MKYTSRTPVDEIGSIIKPRECLTVPGWKDGFQQVIEVILTKVTVELSVFRADAHIGKVAF
jgi:hypothetical protein